MTHQVCMICDLSRMRFTLVSTLFHSQLCFLQSRKKQRDEVDVVGVTPSEMSSSVGGSDGKTREQTIHERIGYKPHPKSNTLPSFFGNLQF